MVLTTDSGGNTGKVAEAYDRAASTYDIVYSTPRYRAENAVLRRRLDFDLGTVLDIGCGTGLLLDIFKLDPADYLGADISAGMLAIAQTKFPRHTFRQSDCALPLPVEWKDRFDTVVSLFCAASYLPDPAPMFEQASRCLRPRGRTFFMLYARGRQRTRCPDATDTLYWTYNVALARERFARYFKDVRISGMTMTDGPGIPLLAPLITRLECQIVGRFWPDLCHYLILEGRR